MHAKNVPAASIESDDDLIAWPEVSRMTGLGEGEAYERRKQDPPTFPQPADLSASPHSKKRTNRWVRGEIKAWVRERIVERDLKLAAEREQARRDREILLEHAERNQTLAIDREHQRHRAKRTAVELEPTPVDADV
jgi:predicted DNA-binding transcriptional regulator AlpA